ncbi:hypothetical protein BU16DRAFT_564004 [Lophium mytilinum]|uniref:Uncharacterized protein n=1 Tax=Lophium mytilinum TaxID=390894 RepID=A0A6A6QKY6_9PEZI|nr:hypothetical protein BU16DRAFT_564004 [Lophium mytilinum]
MKNRNFFVNIVDSANRVLPEYSCEAGVSFEGEGSQANTNRVWSKYARIVSTEDQEFGIRIALPKDIFRLNASGAMVTIALDSSETGEYWTLSDTRFVPKEEWEPKDSGHNGVKHITIVDSIVKTWSRSDAFERKTFAFGAVSKAVSRDFHSLSKRTLNAQEQALQLDVVGKIKVEVQLGTMGPGASTRYFGRSRPKAAPWNVVEGDRTVTSLKSWEGGLQHCVRLNSLGECDAPEFVEDQSFRALNGDNGSIHVFKYVFRPQAIANREGWKLKEGDELPAISLAHTTATSQEPQSQAGPVNGRKNANLRKGNAKPRQPRLTRQSQTNPAPQDDGENELEETSDTEAEPQYFREKGTKKRKTPAAGMRASKRILGKAAAQTIAGHRDTSASRPILLDDDSSGVNSKASTLTPVEQTLPAGSPPAANDTASGSGEPTPRATNALEKSKTPMLPGGQGEEASDNRYSNVDIDDVTEIMSGHSIVDHTALGPRIREWSKKVPISDARTLAAIEAEKARCEERRAYLRSVQAARWAKQAGLEAEYFEIRALRKDADMKRILAGRSEDA